MKQLSACVSVILMVLMDNASGANDVEPKKWPNKILRRQNEHHKTKRKIPDGNVEPTIKRTALALVTHEDWNPGFTLGRCVGDCDLDSDCYSGLVCFQRAGNTAIPNCSGSGPSGVDYCIDPEDLNYRNHLTRVGDNPDHSLGKCQGDCDSNDDCAGELICFQRDGFTAIPGCIGTGTPHFDYCVYPQGPNGGTSLASFGANPTQTLGKCEGDCDSNSDCASGLLCHQRDGTSAVPGCTGTGTSYHDYCIDCAHTRRRALSLGKSRKTLRTNPKKATLRKAFCIPHLGCVNQDVLNGHEYGEHSFMFDCDIDMHWAQHTDDNIRVEFYKPSGEIFALINYSVTEDQCRMSGSEILGANVWNNSYKGALGYVKVTIGGGDAFHLDKVWTCKGGADGCRSIGSDNDISWCLSTDSTDGADCTESRYFFHEDSCCDGTIRARGTTRTSC